MKCPNCGTIEQGRIRTCTNCGTFYASQDLLELRQLEFLLNETEQWPNTASRRKPYEKRLEELYDRILPAKQETPIPAEPDIELETVTNQQVIEPPQKKADAVPFDQWLLSERNIKIALYSGGLLLVLAGLIFVGINWGKIPGPAKFAITLMITGLMYLGGYLMFQRPTLKLGGATLLGIASGFVPLNFVVLQIYIFSARGLSPNMMWFIASIPILLLYFLTAYWTRSDLFGYLGIGAVISAFTAGLVLLNAPIPIFILTYTLLALIFLFMAGAIQNTLLVESTRIPLIVVSQIAMPILYVSSLIGWAFYFDCTSCLGGGSPWLGLVSMFIAVAFYVTTDIVLHWMLSRWVAAFAFAVAFTLLLIQLNFSGIASAITLMLLSVVYLIVGNVLQTQYKKSSHGWPLYSAGYALAIFVTTLTIITGDMDDLAKVLIGDVLLLAISAWAHKQYNWTYGAVWLFIAPVSIYSSIYLNDLTSQGLVLGVMLLNYTAIGYFLGRQKLSQGGPFLTASAFLSILVVILTWENPVIASLALATIAVLYLLVALWVNWSWLLFPALASVEILVISIFQIFFKTGISWDQPLTITYAVLGVALTLGGAALQKSNRHNWGWPLYIVAVLNLAGTYISALLLGGSLAIGLSIIFALLLLWLAWTEKNMAGGFEDNRFLTYIGIALLFIGHFYVIGLMSRQAQEKWTIYTALFCALFIAISWALREASIENLYGTPVRRAGSWLLIIPIIASVVNSEALTAAFTFGIAGVIFAADASMRRILNLAYLSIGAFIVVIWAILDFFKITEPQAYVLPLGLGLVALGLNEKRLGRRGSAIYLWSTLLGLIILMGTAFIQSLDVIRYAVLLLIESLIAVNWGIRSHSRRYVQLGALSLIANAIVQFGPSFVEISRWIQLAIIGIILLGGGMIGLFKREQLLATRKKLVEEWRKWES